MFSNITLIFKTRYIVMVYVSHVVGPGHKIHRLLYCFQAQAPNSPVIIVGTHLDMIKEKKSPYPPTWEDSMTRLIMDKYHIQDADKSGLPRVIGVMNVCCTKGKRGENIERLKNEIFTRVFELKHPGLFIFIV